MVILDDQAGSFVPLRIALMYSLMWYFFLYRVSGDFLMIIHCENKVFTIVIQKQKKLRESIRPRLPDEKVIYITPIPVQGILE